MIIGHPGERQVTLEPPSSTIWWSRATPNLDGGDITRVSQMPRSLRRRMVHLFHTLPLFEVKPEERAVARARVGCGSMAQPARDHGDVL